MCHSSYVRSDQLRAIYLLVGECRELGADAFVWRQHLLECLVRLLGDHVGIGAEGLWSLPDRIFLQPAIVVDRGWDTDSERHTWLEFMKRLGPNSSPSMPSLVNRLERHCAAASRREILDDKTYYASEYFEYKRSGSLDDEMYSLHELSAGHYDILTAYRHNSDKRWTMRDVKLLELVHAEVASMIGSELASFAAHDPVPLSHRLEQTLDALLEGLDENQIATELSLSQHTVHQYVKMLYRRYHVGSRAELLSLWIRRHQLVQATQAVGN